MPKILMLVAHYTFRVIFIFCLCLIVNGCGGYKSKYYKFDPKFHEKELTFNVPMIYVLTEGFEDDFDKETSKYGRELVPKIDLEVFHEVSGNTIQSESLPMGMQFTIKKSFLLIPYGTASGFNSKIFCLVVEDENNVLSVVRFTVVEINSDFKL